jgi:hypothetical protein
LYRRRSEGKGNPTVYSRYYISNRAAENLNVMRKAAPHLLRKTAAAEKRFSVQSKMFRAAFSGEFLYARCSAKLNDVALQAYLWLWLAFSGYAILVIRMEKLY